MSPLALGRGARPPLGGRIVHRVIAVAAISLAGVGRAGAGRLAAEGQGQAVVASQHRVFLPNFAAKLQRSVGLVGPGKAGRRRPALAKQREQDIQFALEDAGLHMASCGDSVAACREGVRTVIEACDTITTGAYSAELRQNALATLGEATEADSVDDASLRRIVEVCERAADRRDLPHQHVLQTLDGVAENDKSSTQTLEAIAGAALRIMQGSELPEDGQGNPRFFLDVMAALSRFAYKVVDDVAACTAVIRAALFVIGVTQNSDGFSSVRLLVMYMLEEILPLIGHEQILVEVLGVVESCADSTFDHTVVRDFAAVMLNDVAQRLGEAHLERVVSACTKLADRPEATRAARMVVHRALSDDFQGGSERKVHLLAKSIDVLEQIGAAMPCDLAFGLLRTLEPPEPRSAAVAERLDRSSPRLPPELMGLVDAFLPPLPEEDTRSQIIRTCARTARSSPEMARAVLNASCLLPRRVGLEAAQSFSGIVAGADGRLAREGVSPGDFAATGRCLAGSIGRAAPGDAAVYLRSLDTAAAERVASQLLEAAVSILDLWRVEQWGSALRPLCGVAGGLHEVCRRALPAAN